MIITRLFKYLGSYLSGRRPTVCTAKAPEGAAAYPPAVAPDRRFDAVVEQLARNAGASLPTGGQDKIRFVRFDQEGRARIELVSGKQYTLASPQDARRLGRSDAEHAGDLRGHLSDRFGVDFVTGQWFRLERGEDGCERLVRVPAPGGEGR